MPAVNPNLIVETLEIFDNNLVSPGTIDAAQENGSLEPSDLVLTSIGNASRALIAPYYPAFQFENKLAQRLDWAATYERPFAEALIRVSSSAGTITGAFVTLRYCTAPKVGETVEVLETAAHYGLDPSASYGTMESVIDEIYKHWETGVELRGRSGLVIVPPSAARSKKGKWTISKPEDPETTALKIKIGVSKLPFKNSFLT